MNDGQIKAKSSAKAFIAKKAKVLAVKRPNYTPQMPASGNCPAADFRPAKTHLKG